MSRGIYKAGQYPEMDQALNWDEVVLKFTASAAGTKHELIGAQTVASSRVYFVTGDGTTDLSAADADALVNRVGITETDEVSDLETGLRTYFTDIAAAADGAECFAFALSFGAQVKDCAAVTMERAAVASDGTNTYNRYELVDSAEILNSVSLSSSDELVKDDGSTAISSSDQLVVVPDYGLVFGLITLKDAGGGIPAANDILTLRALVK
jgi:hypothetical protein